MCGVCVWVALGNRQVVLSQLVLMREEEQVVRLGPALPECLQLLLWANSLWVLERSVNKSLKRPFYNVVYLAVAS